MFQKFNYSAGKWSAFALLAFFFATSCTQTDYSALKTTDSATEFQKKHRELLAEQKARIEAQQKAVRDAVEKNKKSTSADETQKSEKTKTSSDKKKTTSNKPKMPSKSNAKSVKTSGNITLNAPWKCVPKELKIVINQVSRKFGHVIVNSTHRSRRKNRRIGGARSSWHLSCKAVDFRVRGSTRGLYSWLRRHPYVGGLKRYRSGYFHIDIGPVRSW